VTGGRVVEVLESPEAAGERGADLFAAAAREDVSSEGRFTAALSGGSTPVHLFQSLANASGIDWAKVHLFWADERCVPPDHPDCNYRLARELLLSRLPAPGPEIHRVRGELAPEEAARDYEADLALAFPDQIIPRFHLICLGLGIDGHTASLFPGFNPALSSDRNAIAVDAGVRKGPRVTLTLRVINNALRVLFLVTGAAKARIAAEILEGKNGDRYPSGLVAPSGGTLTWLLDREAAALLSHPHTS
jgi:6-phosphogluconolactonase